MRRPRRSTLVVLAGFVLAVAVVLVLGADERSRERLHPDNPDPEGARAVAEVLDDQGVSVSVATGAEALEEEEPGAGTTVLVTSADDLGPGTADHLLRTAEGATVVVAEPGIPTSEALGVEPPTPAEAPGVAASCTAMGLSEGLEIEVDSARAHATARGCFTTDEGHLLAYDGGGLVLLGAGQILENEQVTRADNAAVALRVLGQEERLVWYVPQLSDLTGEDRTDVWSLLPPWVQPALVLLVLAGLALVLARARRLGPLEVEPLPVSVRSVETTHARGRLYRRADDRAHAARSLRRAALRRTTSRLGLAPSTPTPTIVEALAHDLDRPAADVGHLVDPGSPAPTTDDDLIRLADELAGIEEEGSTR